MSPRPFQTGHQATSSPRARRWGFWAAPALLATVLAGGALSQGRAPFQVTIKDDNPVLSEEAVGPLDPVRRINYQPTGMGSQVQGANNETLHLSHFSSFHIDGQVYQGQPGGGRYEYMNRPLPRGKGGKDREGFESVFLSGTDLRITCTVSVVPTKPATRGAKRLRDAVLIHYRIENKGNRPHRFGLRVYMDVFVVNNDGALFAAPTHPGKILDGMILKGKELPPYLQMLQIPNLKNPGYVSHMTFDLGNRIEKPDRVVLSRFGAAGVWDLPVFMAGGDSAMAAFWEPKEIKPGAKREIAYAYGKGIATSPESEGAVKLALGGSFEPGKAFDVTAYVTDPATGQFLTLDLPAGMALVQGPQTQPVPEVPGDEATSVVRWRARVLRPGAFPLRVRSSTGITQGKTVTVTPAGR
jgi:hypothetical protein